MAAVSSGYEAAFLQSVRELAASAGKISEDKTEGTIKIFACPEYMADEKETCYYGADHMPKRTLKSMRVSEEDGVDCSFAVIDPLIRENSRIWRITSCPGETRLNVCETEDSEGVAADRCTDGAAVRTDRHR